MDKDHTGQQAGWSKRIDQMMRKSGPRGGTMGGPGGVLRGSIAGDGMWRLNGLMMMGGIAGGAEGGFLWPAAS
jgi:hypothetical protein